MTERKELEATWRALGLPDAADMALDATITSRTFAVGATCSVL